MKLSILHPKFTVVLILACLATPAAAQFEPMFNPVQMANDQLNSHLIFRPVRDAAARSNSDVVSDKNTPQSDTPSLSFSPSQSRRRANLAAFIDRTRKIDPNGADAMQQLVMSSDVISQIDQVMRPLGLRADNVADAYAVWWVAAWQAVNNRDLGSSEAVYSSVKTQTSNALISTPAFASVTDAQKQELAESMLVQAAMIDAYVDFAAGNPTQQAALAKAVNQGAKKMGLDLTKMNLTEKGFVPR